MTETDYEYTSLDPCGPDYRAKRAHLENGAGWEVAEETTAHDNAVLFRRPARIREIERIFALNGQRLLIPRENGTWAASIRPAPGAPPPSAGPPTVGGLATPLAAAEAALRHHGPPPRLDDKTPRLGARSADEHSGAVSHGRRQTA